MKRYSSRPLAALTLLFTALLQTTTALYFYMDSNTPKCFTEELVHETLVAGHYSLEIYNSATSSYSIANQPVQLHITIDETFDNNHRVFDTKAAPSGKFTFTAYDSGDHKMCFTALGAGDRGGWLSSGMPAGGVKLNLDLAIGDTSDVTSGDQTEMEELISKVKDLNNRLEGIRREQVHQREREAEFRDVSETVNARVVKWALIQLAVLGIVCAWQLSHLRSFFIKQKLT